MSRPCVTSQQVQMFLLMFGRLRNLELLEGATIACDYDAALAELDRGVQLSKATRATNDGFAVGVAMAPMVIRDGKVNCHLMLNANIMAGLLCDPESDEHQQATYLIAHECGHVHAASVEDKSLPGVLMRPRSPDQRPELEIAWTAWDEYIACCLSAEYGFEKILRDYESTCWKVLEGLRERGIKFIRAYRTHAKIDQLAKEMSDAYGNMVKYLCYLPGEIDGKRLVFEEAAPDAHALIQKNTWFIPLFERLRRVLSEMRESYGKWAGLQAFDPFISVVHDLLKAGGIDIQNNPEGWWIDVPSTPETDDYFYVRRFGCI